MNNKDLLGDDLYICENQQKQKLSITKTKRIGIDYAEEYKDKLWRFVLTENL